MWFDAILQKCAHYFLQLPYLTGLREPADVARRCVTPLTPYSHQRLIDPLHV